MTPEYDLLLTGVFLLVPLALVGWTVYLRRGRHDLSARNQTRPAIDRRAWIESSFDTMRDDGWDPASPHEWSFLFLDPNRRRLRAFAQELSRLGYSRPVLELARPNIFHTIQYRLTVGRVACHSVDSLLAECERLDRLAWDHGVQTFDGWETPLPGA